VRDRLADAVARARAETTSVKLRQLMVNGAVVTETPPPFTPPRGGPVRFMWVDEDTGAVSFLTREEAADRDPRWAPAVDVESEEIVPGLEPGAYTLMTRCPDCGAECGRPHGQTDYGRCDGYEVRDGQFVVPTVPVAPELLEDAPSCVPGCVPATAYERERHVPDCPTLRW
jgi:hypothetical protein